MDNNSRSSSPDNGTAFTKLEQPIRYHLAASVFAREYNPVPAGLAQDLRYRIGPIEPVLARLDRRLQNPPHLLAEEFEPLMAFVREGLFDARARKQNLCNLVPTSVQSGLPTLQFEGCRAPR